MSKRKKLYVLIFSCVIFFRSIFPAFGSATSSDAEFNSEKTEGVLDEIPLINDLVPEETGDGGGSGGLLGEILGHVKSLDDFFVSAEIATVSDASVSDQADYDGMDQSEAVSFVSDSVPIAVSGPDRYVNVLRYDVIVGADSYICLFSREYIDCLYVDGQKRLWNMSTSTIQGRVVSASFDPYVDEGDLVYLTPCLGNNFSSIRDHGSPNYIRSYYWNGSRYTYRDTYCELVVEKAYYPFMMSQFPVLILIFLVGGGVLICWLNRFRRY